MNGSVVNRTGCSSCLLWFNSHIAAHSCLQLYFRMRDKTAMYIKKNKFQRFIFILRDVRMCVHMHVCI